MIKCPANWTCLKEIDENLVSFVLDNYKVIDYRDIADFINMKPDKLKEILFAIGIKLPFERARKWKEIDVGKFRSIKECALCQVQKCNDKFYVGINDCRKCYEKNIRFWVEEKAEINISFPEKY